MLIAATISSIRGTSLSSGERNEPCTKKQEATSNSHRLLILGSLLPGPLSSSTTRLITSESLKSASRFSLLRLVAVH